MDVTARNSGGSFLRLLGGFALTAAPDAGTLAVPRQAQRLIAFLSLRGSTDRRVVCGRLWPELLERSARAALRNALWQVTRGNPGTIECGTDGVLSLDVALVTDVALLRDTAWSAITKRDVAPGDDDALFCLAVLADAELLPGWYDDWLDEAREDLRQLRMHGLEALSEELLRRGRYALALQAAMEVRRMDPLRETATAAIMSVHLAEGNRIEAIRCFEAFKGRLANDLRVEPSPELTQSWAQTLRELGTRRR